MLQNIVIKNAHLHNLKNIDVEIPRNRLVVITGPSGSGKSSLAFDTLYAEGQRRYVESLSTYVRQFMGRMHKPEVDYIKGLPPAIAIQQRVLSNNPHSTVGTMTEIYEYLKLLYARVGHTFSPVSGEEVRHDTIDSVTDFMLSLPEGTTALLLSQIPLQSERTLQQQLELLTQQGFSRVEIGGAPVRIADLLEQPAQLNKVHKAFVVVDRVTIRNTQEIRNRLSDSIQTAFYQGNDNACTIAYEQHGKQVHRRFSQRFEADGMEFAEPTPNMFSFNNPMGACPTCNGDGQIAGINPDLVIPDPTLSVYEDGIACWRGEIMRLWKDQLIANAAKFHFPVHTPICDLTDEQRRLLWTGNRYFEGLDAFFKYVDSQIYKIQFRVLKARYRGRTPCPDCHGTRLRRETAYVRVGGKNINEIVDLPVSVLLPFFDRLKLNNRDTQAAKRLLTEIRTRLHLLDKVGLNYLTLNRPAGTLSGGESQRISLVTTLGNTLVGSLYVLDEPSIGLHARDTERLIAVLRELQAAGNTVVVVEHDQDMIRAADNLIDMGPAAGRNGGEIVWQGLAAKAKAADIKRSITLKYLYGHERIKVPQTRRRWNNYIEILGASAHNLKRINVKIPLQVMTVVTGVSGSGKSTLVRDVLYVALKGEHSSAFRELRGSTHLICGVEFVSQNPIGKSTRSNPATYIGVYDDIRRLFAEQPLSKQMHFTASYFSFNQEGGRCEMCQGEGTVTVPMQFMSDLVMECEACHGHRFKNDILQVFYRGRNIYDVLEMTVNQAIEFFGTADDKGMSTLERRIVRRLQPLQDVGVGYLKLGQSSSTLSGGENQRVKLAAFMADEQAKHTLFIFDEPTTGLHTDDIRTLLRAFEALIARGHTVLIIEHNMDVIKCADYVIDMGPEGGIEGGYVVCCGTPEDVVQCSQSYTGKYLKAYLTCK